MKTTDYTQDFEAVWDVYKIACHPGSFGSKFEAYLEWKKLRPQPIAEELIRAIHVQKYNDKYTKGKNEFVPTWKHFCRWLKYRCWEGVVDISAEERRKKQVIEEAARDRKRPIPEPIIFETSNIAEEFERRLKQKRG